MQDVGSHLVLLPENSREAPRLVLNPHRQPASQSLAIIPVLRIRIRMDPELLPGSGIIVPDPDPAKNERAGK